MSGNESLADDFGRLFLRLHRLMDRRMSAQGASLARTKLLLFLDRHGPSRAADIAEFFGQAPRSVTDAVDALERAGLVSREADPDDRRVKRVSISDAGRSAIGSTEPLRLQLVEEIFGSLDATERKQLAVLLEKLSGVTEEIERRDLA